MSGLELALVERRSAQADIAGLELVAGGLNQPVFATHAPGDAEHLFVVEKGGTIKRVNLSTGAANVFLTIPGTDVQEEGGLLGLAFHPGYADPESSGLGKFYVHVTLDNGDTPFDEIFTSPFSSHIREYRAMSNDPTVADPASAKEVLNWIRPWSQHVGGWIGFNPAIEEEQAQYLYIASGDGLPARLAQVTIDNRHGQILRLDVNGDDFLDDEDRNYALPPDNPFVGALSDSEIWAYGLRNPWRASFDRHTGDFWIGDVGWYSREEINRQAADAPGGANYGWVLREGDIQTPGPQGGPEPEDYVAPVYAYAHDFDGEFDPFTGNAVVGGYVYRGPDPELYGKYIFGDTMAATVWMFDPEDPLGTRQDVTSLLTSELNKLTLPVSFSEDPVGNLYVVDHDPTSATSGKVYRIITDKVIEGDYDADGDVDHDDYLTWFSAYGSDQKGADGNGSGRVGAADYVVWRYNLGRSVRAVESAGALSGSHTVLPGPSSMTIALLFFGIGSQTLRRRRSMGISKTGIVASKPARGERSRTRCDTSVCRSTACLKPAAIATCAAKVDTCHHRAHLDLATKAAVSCGSSEMRELTLFGRSAPHSRAGHGGPARRRRPRSSRGR